MTSLWVTSSGVLTGFGGNPTSFGGKLGGGRPVVSWIFQETTLHGSCETGIGGKDDDPTLIEKRVPACPQGRP